LATRAIAIEDDEAIGRLIESILKGAGYDFKGIAPTGEEGIALAIREKPEIALVDLGLPKMSGEQVIGALKEKCPKTLCIALTAVDIPARVMAALRAGAAGYVLKPFRSAELVQAVQDVLTGNGAPLSSRAAKILLGELRGDPPVQTLHTPLSARELEVLQLLVHGKTYGEVATALGIAEGTVQTYVKRIYEKLDVSSKAEAALLAVTRGLVKP
jgi:DNA-binding NarL/FixJ family response regulator